MLELLDYFGTNSGIDAQKNAIPHKYEDGNVLRAPTLDFLHNFICGDNSTGFNGELLPLIQSYARSLLNASKRVFECEVLNTFETSDARLWAERHIPITLRKPILFIDPST